jgi:Ribbon-helix-helix protein, copG family
MAKVMVSMPDDLLAEVDAEAERTGSNRSAVLRGYAEAAIRRRRAKRAASMEELLRGVEPHGGNSAEVIKATRPDNFRYQREPR